MLLLQFWGSIYKVLNRRVINLWYGITLCILHHIFRHRRYYFPFSSLFEGTRLIKRSRNNLINFFLLPFVNVFLLFLILRHFHRANITINMSCYRNNCGDSNNIANIIENNMDNYQTSRVITSIRFFESSNWIFIWNWLFRHFFIM